MPSLMNVMCVTLVVSVVLVEIRQKRSLSGIKLFDSGEKNKNNRLGLSFKKAPSSSFGQWSIDKIVGR